MSSQIDTDGFQQVKSKRGPGPRGQRKQKASGPQRRERNEGQTEGQTEGQKENQEAPRERLSFKDLLFERNNLKKHEHSPKVDLWEDKDEHGSYYMIRMEIPGVNKNKINIDIKENQIVLVTAFKSGDKPDPESVVYSECRYGKIIRRVKVPNLISEDVRIKYEDGVLKIELVQIPVEEKVEILDPSLDDEQVMGAHSTLNNETVNETVIDFKDLSQATGNWADIQ
jgi:HSP20 family molecular chaperone IbpA